MLRTNGQPNLAIEGTNQQDFSQIQRIEGTYPHRQGVQKRVPGKTLQSFSPDLSAIGSIYVFYLVYGRHYILTAFGDVQIIEVDPGSTTFPPLPPSGNQWWDDFSGYLVDTISRLWGAGVWPNGVGVCESIIDGYFDPFLVYATIAPGSYNPDLDKQPKPLPPPPTDPSIPPADPGSGPALYPPGTADFILGRVFAHSNNSCTGQGTQLVGATDYINYYDVPGGTIIDQIAATAVTVGGITLWHGYKVGRKADEDIGLVVGTCPGPPFPTPNVYFAIAATGEHGQES